MFLWSQKVQKIVLWVILRHFQYWQAVSSHECFSEHYWNHFSFRVMFWKGSYRCLTAGKKKIKISRTLSSVHNIFIIIINPFCQVINLSGRSAYGSSSCNLITCYNFFLIAVIGTRHTNENYWSFQPLGIYLLKVNTRNTRRRCEVCSKLTIKTPEIRQRTSFWSLYY